MFAVGVGEETERKDYLRKVRSKGRIGSLDFCFRCWI